MRKWIGYVATGISGVMIGVLIVLGYYLPRQQHVALQLAYVYQQGEDFRTIIHRDASLKIQSAYSYQGNKLLMQIYPSPESNMHPRHLCAQGHTMVLEYDKRSDTQHVTCHTCKLRQHVNSIMRSYSLERYDIECPEHQTNYKAPQLL